MINRINSPHDRFFKSMMEDHDVSREFLIANLPSHIKDIVDLNTIKFHKESFIDKELSLKMVDILVETKFNGEPGYIYVLIEHQSKPDKLMSLRIWSYMIKIWERHITNNKTDDLPAIYPMIFYSGIRNYNHSTNLLDLFSNKELVQSILGTLLPIPLTALNKISDDELGEFHNYRLLALFAKHIHDKDSIVLFKKTIQSVYPNISVKRVTTIVQYLISFHENAEIEDFRRILDEIGLPKEYEEGIMTLADRLRQEGIKLGMQKGIQEGRQEGIQEGRQEGEHKKAVAIAKNLLAMGVSIEQVTKATQLSRNEIEVLKLMRH